MDGSSSVSSTTSSAWSTSSLSTPPGGRCSAHVSPSTIVATPTSRPALVGFAEAHDALPVCGTDEEPPVLAALARRLGGPVRYVSAVELERTALPGVPPHREPGCAAHQRALLAGLAAAEGLGDLGLEDL